MASVRSEDNFNDAYVELVATDDTNGIRARVEIHKEDTSGPKRTKIWATTIYS